MGLKSYAKFEPNRLAAAIGAFGIAVAGLVALLSTVAIGGAVAAVWAAGVGIFNAVFVRNSVTPNVSVPDLVHDTIVALAPYAPKVTTVGTVDSPPNG